mgnify:CR=1 FL=1
MRQERQEETVGVSGLMDKCGIAGRLDSNGGRRIGQGIDLWSLARGRCRRWALHAPFATLQCGFLPEIGHLDLWLRMWRGG